MNKTWRHIYDLATDHTKKLFIRWVVVRILGASAGGFWGWLVALLASHAFDRVVKPFTDWIKRKIVREVAELETRKQLQEIRDAENLDDWRRRVRELN